MVGSSRKASRRVRGRKKTRREEQIAMLMIWEQAEDEQRLRFRTYNAVSRRSSPIDMYGDFFTRHG